MPGPSDYTLKDHFNIEKKPSNYLFKFSEKKDIHFYAKKKNVPGCGTYDIERDFDKKASPKSKKLIPRVEKVFFS
jgi:hypothetical protein